MDTFRRDVIERSVELKESEFRSTVSEYIKESTDVKLSTETSTVASHLQEAVHTDVINAVNSAFQTAMTTGLGKVLSQCTDKDKCTEEDKPVLMSSLTEVVSDVTASVVNRFGTTYALSKLAKIARGMGLGPATAVLESLSLVVAASKTLQITEADL